jgi:hypothetical protein
VKPASGPICLDVDGPESKGRFAGISDSNYQRRRSNLAPAIQGSIGISGRKFGGRGKVVLLAAQVSVVLNRAFEQLIAAIVELTAVLA